MSNGRVVHKRTGNEEGSAPSRRPPRARASTTGRLERSPLTPPNPTAAPPSPSRSGACRHQKGG